MTVFAQSFSHNQRYFLSSFPKEENDIHLISGRPIYYHNKNPIFYSADSAFSEYIEQEMITALNPKRISVYKPQGKSIVNLKNVPSKGKLKHVGLSAFHSHKNYHSHENENSSKTSQSKNGETTIFKSHYLNQLHPIIISSFNHSSMKLLDKSFSEQPASVYYKKPLKDLQDKILQVYDEHQEEGWDGYGAKPLQNLKQALWFAEVLFKESRVFVENADIIPENDGAICFEWFLSHEQYVSISVKNDKLIYHYQIGEEIDCGEKSMVGQQMLFSTIARLKYHGSI